MLELDPQQKAASQYVKSPLLILAGAGSGKTSLLACKIAWLLREYGVEPAGIVTLTVNAYTARVIRNIVNEKLGANIPGLTISTFNEFIFGILQRHPRALGLHTNFSLYDYRESEAIVSRLIREINIAGQTPVVDTWRYIASWKNDGATPPPATHNVDPSPKDIAATLYSQYERCLETSNAVDLPGLASKAAQLLTLDSALLAELRNRIRFLLIDEYEQSNTGEHEVVRLLAETASLTVTADDNILARQTDSGRVDNLPRLQVDFPNLRVVRLDHNYRATARVLNAIAHLNPRDTTNPGMPHPRKLGAPLRVLYAKSEQDEAEQIAKSLLDRKTKYGDDYRHYAILFRQQAQSVFVERALQAYRIPYQHGVGVSRFEQEGIRDFWAYLSLACNPADDNAFLRAIHAPRRDINRETLECLKHFAAERGQTLLAATSDPALAEFLAPQQYETLQSAAGVMHALAARLQHTDLEQLARNLLTELHFAEWLRDTCNDNNIAGRHLDNIVQMISLLGRFTRRFPGAAPRTVLTQFNARLALGLADDDPDTDSVTLMMLPNVHGREYKHVYLVGLDAASFSESAIEMNPDGEACLAYLGLTRAHETVTFTLVERRRFPTTHRPGNGFLNQLPPEDVEWVHTHSDNILPEGVLSGAEGTLHRTWSCPR